jgi:hypothetical protein
MKDDCLANLSVHTLWINLWRQKEMTMYISNPKPKPEPKFNMGDWFWIAGLAIGLGFLAYNLLSNGSPGEVAWFAFWAGGNFGCLYATHVRW